MTQEQPALPEKNIRTAIDAAVALELAPFLAAQGFRKSGRDFHRDDGESIAVFNVQASRSNAGNTGRFALNVGRYFPAVAASEDTLKAGRWPKEHECTIRRRVAAPEDQGDRWWRVWTDRDNAEVACEARQFVDTHALPWLARTSTLAGLRAEGLPKKTAACVALLAGDVGEAVRIARSLADQGLGAYVEAWARRNGVSLP
jgi:hypothetical protein